MRKRKYIAMGIMGALCSATRNTGVFLAFAIAVYYTECYLKEAEKPTPVEWFVNAIRQPRLVLGVLLIPMGLFSFMIFLYHRTGDGLAFMHIQRAWGGSMQNPLTVLVNGLTSQGSIDFYWALFALLWILAVWKLWKHRKLPEMVMCAIYLLIPLSIRLQSMPRYMIGSVLPMYGLVMDYSKWTKAQKVVVFAASLLWEIHCVYRWVIGDTWLY